MFSQRRDNDIFIGAADHAQPQAATSTIKLFMPRYQEAVRHVQDEANSLVLGYLSSHH